MGWELAVALNVVIAASYVMISSLILLGLVRTRQVSGNPLAVATAAIFTTCAIHHGHHAAHLMTSFGPGSGGADLVAVRAVFGEWHTVLVDGLGAIVAMTYLGLRRSYKALLNTPAMFEDAVRRAAEERLRDLAYTDQLTGIANRAAYQQHADALRDVDLPAVVLFVDLDGFKQVNDAYGHDAGDRLLRTLAQALVDGVPEWAHVYRLGGDEFVVVAVERPGAPRDLDLRAVVEAVVRAPQPVRGGTLVLSASVGIARGRASTVDALVRDADAAMYERKRRRAQPPHPRAEPAAAPSPVLPAG